MHINELIHQANCLTENRYRILIADRMMRLVAGISAVESMQNSKSLLHFSQFLVNANSDVISNYIFRTSFKT